MVVYFHICLATIQREWQAPLFTGDMRRPSSNANLGDFFPVQIAARSGKRQLFSVAASLPSPLPDPSSVRGAHYPEVKVRFDAIACVLRLD